MNEEQKANVRLLVDALRSDEFQQAKSVLRTDVGMCCLGVGCEVYRRTTGQGEWDTGLSDAPYTVVNPETGSRDVTPQGYVFTTDGEFDHDLQSNDEMSIAQMPQPVAEWFGFDNGNPDLKTGEVEEDVERPASDLNDLANLNFAQIADAFERTFLA